LTTSTGQTTLDAYGEDHDGNGVVLFFCFLCKNFPVLSWIISTIRGSSSSNEAPAIQSRSGCKAFTAYWRLHHRNITGSGRPIFHTHWISIQEALEEV